ncbi:MAG: leucine-rich repeat domain-containing protein [Promethearchaeota archaeon]
MALNPKKIYEDLKRKDINKLAAVDSLIFLIGNNDNIEIRRASIKILQKIGIKNEKIFSLLEDLLVSDPNQEIKEQAADCLKVLFQERALSPLKWTLDHESSWQFLLLIVSIIKEINNRKAKSIFIEKIKKFDNYKFIKSLSPLFKTEEIQSFKTSELVEIINNHIVIKFFEDILEKVKFKIEKGVLIELDLSFISNNNFGWKILKTLSESIRVINKLTKLELRGNRLGNLPNSIFSLPFLKFLDMSHNNLEKLSDRFDALKSLEYLNLRYNNLTEIPNSVGSLENLKTLDLKHNRLTTLPISFGDLISLESLNLHGNQFTTIPSIIEKLTSLKKLKVGLNHLKNVPEWIKNLRSLKKLGLGGNKDLSKAEEWICFLPSILELNLYNNNIKALPESIGSLESLEVLILHNNHLTTLPESFGKLISLKKLDLSWNNITNLPEWISSLSSLEELNLRGNKLSNLPESITSLHSLKVLNITLNKNIIQLPKELENKALHIMK